MLEHCWMRTPNAVTDRRQQLCLKLAKRPVNLEDLSFGRYHRSIDPSL